MVIAKRKKRKGNLLITVVLCFLVLILLSGALTLATNGRTSARSKASTLTDMNTALVMSNIVASSMKEAIENSGITKNTGIETELDVGMYDEALNVINGRLFLFDGATGVRTYGNGSTNEVMQNVYYDSEDVEFNAEELAKQSSYSLKVNVPLELDYGEIGNIINLASGDSIALRNIEFTLQLRYNGRLIKQEYSLEGEKAVFTVAEGFFNLSFDGEDSKLKLVSQSITY